MKTFIVLVLLSALDRMVYAQDTITGLWHSRDSSRIYAIFKSQKYLEGSLHTSKRSGDKIGVTVLKGLKYNQAKNVYEGIIYAVDDGMATQVVIRMAEYGKILILKLRRMFFIPVYIKWYRVE